MASVGPQRPSAAGDDLVVEAAPLETPLVLDPLPSGVTVSRASYNRTDVYGTQPATLYGDPDLADTLDGPVLLVARSVGGAVVAGPRLDESGARAVDLDGQEATLVPDGDRTWVVVHLGGEDTISYVVARGLSEDELLLAAASADFEASPPMLDAEALPAGLVALVTGPASDGPFSAVGEWLDLEAGEARVRVSAVRAPPRLAALWGFWTDDEQGSVTRGQPGSAGAMPGILLWDEAFGRVWAEDGRVISVIGTPGADDVVEAVTSSLRVGNEDEFDALASTVIESVPPDAMLCAGTGPGLTDRVGDLRWAIQFHRDAEGRLQRCDVLITPENGASSGVGDFAEKPPGGLSFDTIGWGDITQPDAHGTLVNGVAPPGTERVVVVAPDGRELIALLAEDGPRPGERVYGAFFAGAPFREPASAFGVTAFDADGAVIIPVG